jgi:hypothetical protein
MVEWRTQGEIRSVGVLDANGEEGEAEAGDIFGFLLKYLCFSM